MATRDIALTPEQNQLIDALVRSGRYRDADDVVQQGLKLLEDVEILDHTEAEEVRCSVEEGRLSIASRPNTAL